MPNQIESTSIIESGKTLKVTSENLKYGDDLIQAIEIADKFKIEIEEYEIQLKIYNENMKTEIQPMGRPSKPIGDVLMNNMNLFDYILKHLKLISRAEIENTLKYLPLSYIFKLLFYLEHYIRKVYKYIYIYI